jgi:hypothetical protein
MSEDPIPQIANTIPPYGFSPWIYGGGMHLSAPAPKEPMHDPWTPYHISFRGALLPGAPFGRETIGSSCNKLQEPALLLCFPEISLFSSTFCFSSSSSSYVLSPKSAHPVSPKSPKPLALLQQAAPPTRNLTITRRGKLSKVLASSHLGLCTAFALCLRNACALNPLPPFPPYTGREK